VRIPDELEAKITAWIERQPGLKPSRSEAIRRLIEKGLENRRGPIEEGNDDA
jgi:Arc/MetJ-type ribon-helix-helix transcriptional regulator